MTNRLTKNQQAALRCLKETGQFHVPPRNQGQTVEVSYGCSPEHIYERAHDRADRSVSVCAYAHPAGAQEGSFQPWNGVPRLGRYVGIIFSGDERDEP